MLKLFDSRLKDKDSPINHNYKFTWQHCELRSPYKKSIPVETYFTFRFYFPVGVPVEMLLTFGFHLSVAR